MKTFSFTAGRLLWPHIRDGFRKMQFQGLEFEWMESSGFLWREFTVKADNATLVKIADAIEGWAEKNELTESGA